MPELILSDIAMPQLDGYSLAAGLKADPITANIPLIFISAKRRPQNVNRMAEERSVGYLTKPFSVPQLLSEIRSLLDRQIEQ